MKTIIIDGKSINNKESFHKHLKLQMGLPEYYGNNLDALWDCLTGEIELPLEIIWKNFDSSKTALGDYADKTADIFIKAGKKLGNRFLFKIQ